MEELLALALVDPVEATLRARAVLDAGPDALASSFARQCLGIVHRDANRPEMALPTLRAALRDARRSGVEGREADVRATYGVALMFAGRSRHGLSELTRAADDATGESAAKVQVRLGSVLTFVGRHDEAADVVRGALAALDGTGETLWEARTRIWLAHIELTRGRLVDAEEEVARAERLYESLDETVEQIAGVENLAEIALARGDLARGLRLYRDSEARYAAAGRPPRFELVRLRASAMSAAGLHADAVDLLADFGRRVSLPANEEAEFQLAVADAALAAGDTDAAIRAASAARASFRRQSRAWQETRARLTSLRARVAASPPQARPRPAEAVAVADALDRHRAHEAPVALVLAGAVSRGVDRQLLWGRAASYRTHPNALVRAAAWHARSLASEAESDRGGVLRAAAAGLDAIDEHRRLIGSSELRALATTHGRDLTTVALRHAATDPRTLLRWSERTRATALAQPPVTSDAATIPASLAALRDNGRRLAEARQEGEPTESLERERLRVERAVRSESHTVSATAGEQRPPAVQEVVTSVGDGCLVELVDVDGVLHVLVVHGGRVRRRVAGTTAEVGALLGPAAMLLRRTARGRPADTTALGRQLQDAILGDAARLLPDGPVVLVPTARLHGLPWALLPALADRPFSVVPSAGQWLRASATRRPARNRRRTLLVTGPGLATGGAEVPVLAGRHAGATLLAGPDATLEAVLAQLDGADLVHLAAHGHFRVDSPLFSSLDLADGPLTVHDLERVRRAPYRVVLSACESGVLAPVGAEELLGLAAALFSLGTAGLVSSVAEVNDAATADLMTGLHTSLAAGADPAGALLEVRRSVAGDPVAAGTAAAFLALGV